MIADMLSKMTYFISCHKTNVVANIIDLLFRKIVQLHGVPRSIMSYHVLSFLATLGRFCGVSWEQNYYFLPLVIHIMIKLK